MMRLFFRSVVLCLACLCSTSDAHAQAPLVANGQAPSYDLFGSGGAFEPDTTAPWRYFPLAVGNAWEYYNYLTGERRRVDVYGTETYIGLTSLQSMSTTTARAQRGGTRPVARSATIRRQRPCGSTSIRRG